MKLVNACEDILGQLEAVIQDLRDDHFSLPIETLNHSTIGQHIRHTLEFFSCLMSSYNSGVVNYDQRDHDKIIESDKTLALELIQDMKKFINNINKDVPLILEANYCVDEDTIVPINTNLFRELTYNIEHAIHHMAIIKIGLKEVAPYVTIPNHFGVAVSTVKYQQGMA